MLPVPPPDDSPGVKGSRKQDSPSDLVGAIVIVALWILLFTFVPLAWFTPKHLKPLWLHNLVLIGGSALWIVLGILVIRDESVILGAILILAAIGTLGFVLLRVGTTEQ
jgi:hypothetical protein